MSEHLTIGQRARIKRAAQPGEQDPSQEAGELNVVPFLDIITNVMMFVLASLTVGFTTSSEITSPRRPHGPSPGHPESLSLTVIVASDGYYLKTSNGSIAAGCERAGAGAPTVARVAAGDFDVAGLKRCARRLKDEIASDERQVLLTANPNVPAQEIIRAMDALRRDDRGELFPEVILAVVN